MTDDGSSETGSQPDASGGAEMDRRDRRAPIMLKVEYKRLNTFFYDYTKNISKGGTFIKTDRPLPIGTHFVFRLVVPISAEPIELRGEVRWVNKPGAPASEAAPGISETGMGIRFVFAAPEDRVRLERKVEKMIVDSLGQLIYSRLMGSDSTFPAPEAVSPFDALAGSGPLTR